MLNEYFSSAVELIEKNNRVMDSMYRALDIPYYSFTNDTSYTDADFRDVNHLNYQGAQKFSETLSRIVEKNLN